MTTISRVAIVGPLLVMLTGFGSAIAATAIIKQQTPCTPHEGFFCFKFTAPVIPVIRSYAFVAPSKGTALVTFNGSLMCSPAGAYVEYMFLSQIVSNNRVDPDPTGPGGAVHRFIAGATNATVTSNLNATRVFAIGAPGTQHYYFKLKNSGSVIGTSQCFVGNAAFSVVFVPSP